MKLRFHSLLNGLLLAGAALGAHAAPLLEEGFDDASGLPAGWKMANFSSNPAAEAWFKPTDTSPFFTAQAGASDSYFASSVFVAATDAAGNPFGRVDAMLTTPVVAMSEATTLSFWTRTVAGNTFGDSLHVGAIVSGSFVDLMAINPTLTAGAYPEAWTRFTVTLPGQGDGASGRFYFEYLVPDAAKAGNFVGLDSVSIAAAVPEPDTALLMLAGGLLLVARAARRRAAA